MDFGYDLRQRKLTNLRQKYSKKIIYLMVKVLCFGTKRLHHDLSTGNIKLYHQHQNINALNHLLHSSDDKDIFQNMPKCNTFV